MAFCAFTFALSACFWNLALVASSILFHAAPIAWATSVMGMPGLLSFLRLALP